MKNNDYAQVIGPREVRMLRVLPGPIDRLWTYITDSKKRATWLAGGPMELRMGGKVELNFKHKDLAPGEPIPEKFKALENGHTVSGEITRHEPPHVLAFTWSDEPGYASEVTFELTEQGSQVQLLLTHRRLQDVGEMKGVASGWHTHVAVLEARLKGETPPPFWTQFQAVRAEYEERIKES